MALTLITAYVLLKKYDDMGKYSNVSASFQV